MRVLITGITGFVGSHLAEYALKQGGTVSQVNLLEAIRARRNKPRFLVIGSSEEYGLVYEDELPVRETNPLRPLSPYAVSKVTQDLMGYQYFKSYGLAVVRSRAFNHEGPRRGDVFVLEYWRRRIRVASP